MNKTIFSILLIWLSIISSFSQNSFNTCGNNLNQGNGSVSYSIGQTNYEYFTTISGNSNLGVQQPFESFILSNNIFEIGDFLVYPNPFEDEVNLVFKDFDDEIKYIIYDSQGKVILSDSFIGNARIIKTSNISSGLYLFQLISKNNIVKQFNLLKK